MAKKSTATVSPANSDFQKYMDAITAFPVTFSRGQIVKGVVVQVGKGQILVDVGGRAEGVVSGREMKLEGEKN